MNLKDFNLDGIVILTTRSTKTSTVKIIFEYEFVDIEASNTCFRSVEKELELQREILASLGFNDEQIKRLSYE